MDLNKYIVNICKNIGIDIVGFTDYKSISNEKRNWLIERKEKLYETEFEEDDIDIRIDKFEVLPNAKSIIVIGISYNYEDNLIEKNKIYPYGKLSKISYGHDYHLVLRNRLDILKDELLKQIDFDYKIYVDTGPFIDRELAYQAGIGYYGKNCSIINEEYGSFIAIGYMITNLDLKNSETVESQCGDCRLCIDACPTNALFNDFKINPKICISYLTQSKDIPKDLRGKMGIKVYGCDTCQIVCPKNKYVKKTDKDEFNPKKTGGFVDILKLLEMSNKEFKNKYADMSGSWRGKNTLKRNALICLGNIGDKSFLPILQKELSSDSDLIREYAQWAILKIKGEI